MTYRNVERITGCEVVLADKHAIANWEGKEIARVPDNKRGPNALLGTIYRQRRAQVILESGFRCVECGRLLAIDGANGLDVHHEKRRSRGRDDRVENLRPLCSECHDQAHGVKRK